MFHESRCFSTSLTLLVAVSMLALMLGQECLGPFGGGLPGDLPSPDGEPAEDAPFLAQAIGFSVLDQSESVVNFELMLLTDPDGMDWAFYVSDGPSSFLMQVQADGSVDIYSDTMSPLFHVAAGVFATPDGLTLPSDLTDQLVVDGILMTGFDAHFAGRCPQPADDVSEEAKRGARFACLVQDFRDGDQSLMTDVRAVLDVIAEACPAVLTVTDVSEDPPSCDADGAVPVAVQLEVGASMTCSDGIVVFLDRTKLDVRGDEVSLPVVGPQALGQEPLLVNVDLDPPSGEAETHTIEFETQILGVSTTGSIEIETPACGP